MIYVFDAKSRAFYANVRKNLWDKPKPTKRLERLMNYWALLLASWSLHWSSVLTFWFFAIVCGIYAIYGNDPEFWRVSILSAILGCLYWYLLRRIVVDNLEIDLD